jgi:hypothetical protein
MLNNKRISNEEPASPVAQIVLILKMVSVAKSGLMAILALIMR